jgi:transcriptional regulator with XRE-family HTH domain
MQHPGEVVRQVRRLRNLTQRELAGERFSKSYVSAIEHNRTAPSAEALHYFAKRLGQPEGDFVALLQQPDVAKGLAAELHCGDAYQAQGAYQEALGSYESARTHLSLHHDLSTAAQVYAGLGYLIYAEHFPATSSLTPSHSPGQLEHDFLRASSFLLEGVGFYRASGDRLEEVRTRLTGATPNLAGYFVESGVQRAGDSTSPEESPGKEHRAMASNIDPTRVERHGGQPWFESEEGRGSTFFLALLVLSRDTTPEHEVKEGAR